MLPYSWPGKKVIIREKPSSYSPWSDSGLAEEIRLNPPDPESSCCACSIQLSHSSSPPQGNASTCPKWYKILWPFSADLLAGRAQQNEKWQLSFCADLFSLVQSTAAGALQGPWSRPWSTLRLQLSHTLWVPTIPHQQHQHLQLFPSDVLMSIM